MVRAARSPAIDETVTRRHWRAQCIGLARAARLRAAEAAEHGDPEHAAKERARVKFWASEARKWSRAIWRRRVRP